MQNKVIIDKKTYSTKHLSEDSSTKLYAIQFTEKKIEELERMMVFLERSKSVILQKLNNNEY